MSAPLVGKTRIRSIFFPMFVLTRIENSAQRGDGASGFPS